MTRETRDRLVRCALEARRNAYVPYSHWAVGAALLAEDGTLFPGCNVENAAYGPTNCAERTALFSAVAQGKRRFTAIAVAGVRKGNFLPRFVRRAASAAKRLLNSAPRTLRCFWCRVKRKQSVTRLGSCCRSHLLRQV